MQNKIILSTLLMASTALLIACGDTDENTKSEPAETPRPFASTYTAMPSKTTFITNAQIIDGVNDEVTSGNLVITEGRITAIGVDVTAPDGATTIDAAGRYVTPGIIDIHSHLGNYASPSVRAHSDGNEVTSPVTSEVDAEHGVWPQDPGFDEALQGGITTLHILPGSANLFGGRGVTLRNVASRTVQGMKFPEAPDTLKMACGENPKRVYGSKGGPGSRMGNVAGYRKNWIKAAEYKKKRDKGGDSFTRNLQLETLADVLDGKILVQMHCYRADEMVQILDIAKEFDYKVTTFHHAVEAYKIADILAENDVCAAMWADWYGFKMESNDGIRENVPFVHAAGACAMIHSDDQDNIQRLNQEVAKTWADGNRAGLNIPKATAWKWLSTNPAKALGILDETGTLEVGKRADYVIWSSDPFSTYARPDTVAIDGAIAFDRASGLKPKSDFRLGQGKAVGDDT
ncbi:imidazolonepropionase-like amidohydrolase [Litorimonas taeanensis]|uniref:Imidazolonepropionase-like amidohydrolase n=1 Tax=Litorimonas taeanensis TaxID=568099 RepID=A0A420WEQ9_9PROT|nr:amidohydrolase [Litorimonas taeanensis]RKQ69470.1 imidazolonepropionase-like amidohydrolase [Litorimonas taeanensis]